MKNNICSEKHLDLKRTFINIIKCIINKRKPNSNSNMFLSLKFAGQKKDTKFSCEIWAKVRKQFTQQLLLKLKKLRKPDHSRIKFFNMWPFKSQVLIYFDREIKKSLFASFSLFSNFCPRNKLNCLSSLFYFAFHTKHASQLHLIL